MEVLHPGQTIPLLLYNTGVCFLKLDLSDLTRYFFEIERSFVYGERIRCQHCYPMIFSREFLVGWFMIRRNEYSFFEYSFYEIQFFEDFILKYDDTKEVC